jgi:flavin reductase (DIM6/NTAB) family NADH-FMN oxidoreductase RutF
MKLPLNYLRSNKFATSIGLITSSRSYEHNIMAFERTHHLSYDPGLVAVSICPTKQQLRILEHQKKLELIYVQAINIYFQAN